METRENNGKQENSINARENTITETNNSQKKLTIVKNSEKQGKQEKLE